MASGDKSQENADFLEIFSVQTSKLHTRNISRRKSTSLCRRPSSSRNNSSDPDGHHESCVQTRRPSIRITLSKSTDTWEHSSTEDKPQQLLLPQPQDDELVQTEEEGKTYKFGTRNNQLLMKRFSLLVSASKVIAVESLMSGSHEKDEIREDAEGRIYEPTSPRTVHRLGQSESFGDISDMSDSCSSIVDLKYAGCISSNYLDEPQPPASQMRRNSLDMVHGRDTYELRHFAAATRSSAAKTRKKMMTGKREWRETIERCHFIPVERKHEDITSLFECYSDCRLSLRVRLAYRRKIISHINITNNNR